MTHLTDCVDSSNSSDFDEVSYECQTSLFRAIGCKNWTKASSILETLPNQARVWVVTRYHGGSLVDDPNEETVWYRRLPLHHACSGKKAPLFFVQALIQAYPEAVYLEDETGKVPLIHACRRQNSLEVINSVLNEKVAIHCDRERKCALHWACEYTADKAIIQVLVQTAPAVLHHRDMYGRLPLHWECSAVANRKENMSVISFLLEKYPQAVMDKDDDGRTPVQMIDVSEVLELLLKTKAIVLDRSAEAKERVAH